MIITTLNKTIAQSIQSLYSFDIPKEKFQIVKTRKEFEGDITLILFPLLLFVKKPMSELGKEIGSKLLENDEIESFNIVKGFLNLVISDLHINVLLKKIYNDIDYGMLDRDNDSNPISLVEFSSPNTNKPLHLGHIRNILLGESISNILKKTGHTVKKVQVINDRGIHICKSMLAWLKYGNKETPNHKKEKGDFFVGKYYILFEEKLQEEKNKLIKNGLSEKDAIKQSILLNEAKEMLIKWEEGDFEIRELWKKMNSWVYEGFEKTYSDLGTSFDKNYYESQTYLLGKEIIKKGLSKKIFFQKDDGSVWVDLKDFKLDQKLLLRSDGTAVYMTQDVGTALERYSDFKFDNMIYVTGNEQDYHFNTLFKILQKLGYKWSKGCSHLSYGMVNLPDGRMKSREGTVVDADKLIQKMREDSMSLIKKSDKFDDFDDKEIILLSKKIGDAALKYFILKIDAKKNMMFNPSESIDFNGNTGPFIQYSYARIKSVLQKKQNFKPVFHSKNIISSYEKELLKYVLEYPMVIFDSGNLKNPSILANYIYQLAKLYNKFYQKIIILDGSKDEDYRLTISKKVAGIIKEGMSLLGIEVPERM